MSTSLRIAYMGTPDFAVPALHELIHSPHEVVCVFTQPPRPKGRGQKVQPSPVHVLADDHHIPVFTPGSLKKDMDAQAGLAACAPDVIVVAAYGLMLPKNVLDIPRYGCLNIHASLLPRWRGAAPIQYAIWKGDDKSGVTIMQMEEGLDSGPMIAKKSVPIRPQTTAQSLHDELAALGAGALMEVLQDIAGHGGLKAEEQDGALSTYAPVLSKEDGRVDWSQTAEEIDRQVRALNPWPGVYTLDPHGKRIKILEAELVSEAYTEPPGTVADHMGRISCGDDTALRLITVQPENARRMDVVSAMNGGYLKVDDVLE